VELIDTHCHIDVEEFRTDFDLIVSRAHLHGVQTMVMPGVDQQSWARLIALSQTHDGLLAAPGLHPLYMARHRPCHLEELEQRVRHDRLVAIGEIGLDYHVAGIDRNLQQHLFEAQLRIAEAAALPVLLHVRKAHDQVLATLRRKHFRQGGIVHAYSGSYQQACHYIKLGFVIGVGGTITYDRARRVRAIAAQLPLEALVLETDAPDIPLAAHRGERNLPEYLIEVCMAVAELREEMAATVIRYTTANARRVLRLI
jgi:TatD DNase family protein